MTLEQSVQDQPNPPPLPEEIHIPASRLAYGTYNHEREREENEGDVRASYSGDTIAMESKVRRPFRHAGSLWTCVGSSGRGGTEQAECYRLTHLKMFTGRTTTYHEKTGTADGAEAARNDPNGFYDRMLVKNGKESYVLIGPPATFVAESVPERPEDAAPEPQQMSLFA